MSFSLFKSANVCCVYATTSEDQKFKKGWFLPFCVHQLIAEKISFFVLQDSQHLLSFFLRQAAVALFNPA